MACRHYYELISQRLDGELSPDEERELESHLSTCPSCRALAEQLSGLHEDFSALEEVPVPEGFAQSVMARIRAEEQKKVIPLFRRPQFKAMAGLAACLALCVGLYGAGQMDWSGKTAASSLNGISAEAPAPASGTSDGTEAEQASKSSEAQTELFTSAYQDEAASKESEVSAEENAISEEALAPRAYAAQPPADTSGKSALSEPKPVQDEMPAVSEPSADSVDAPRSEPSNNENGLANGSEDHGEQVDEPEQDPGVGTTLAGAQTPCTFQNEQYLSVTYGATPQAPSALILGSVQSLDDYLTAFPEDDLSAVAETYGETYFESGRLLAVLVETGSGSNTFTLAEDALTAEQVVLEENRPEEGTADMAAWLILAEVGVEFSDGDELDVSIVTS